MFLFSEGKEILFIFSPQKPWFLEYWTCAFLRENGLFFEKQPRKSGFAFRYFRGLNPELWPSVTKTLPLHEKRPDEVLRTKKKTSSRAVEGCWPEKDANRPLFWMSSDVFGHAIWHFGLDRSKWAPQTRKKLSKRSKSQRNLRFLSFDMRKQSRWRGTGQHVKNK